jgi:hypothetical protein
MQEQTTGIEKEPRFIPMEYAVDIECGALAGATQRGQIALNNRPFVLKRIKHQIIVDLENVDKPTDEIQDGLYRLDWSIHETTRFWKGSIPLADMRGSIRHGTWLDLDAPVTLPGSETIHAQILNERTRGGETDFFTVQVVFEGLERVD